MPYSGHLGPSEINSENTNLVHCSTESKLFSSGEVEEREILREYGDNVMS